MLTVFKLIYGLRRALLEEAGLSLLKSKTRGGGIRFLRDHVVIMKTCVLFKFRVKQ